MRVVFVISTRWRVDKCLYFGQNEMAAGLLMFETEALEVEIDVLALSVG